MPIFLSTFTNKVDSKGRISVPSQYRNVINKDVYNNVIAYPSFVHECIEACGMDRMQRLSESIDEMDPYSEERDSFATAILGGSEQLSIDKDGRIILPKKLMEFAGINDQAVFVGKGQTFEIWNPQKYESYERKAREIARDKRGNLKISRKAEKY